MNDSSLRFGDPDHGVIVPFWLGERPDWEGRWLAEIRGWDLARLEEDHHYIQWLFPLPVESEVVIAPVLRAHEVAEIKSSSRLQSVMLGSLQQLLPFYGYALNDAATPSIVPLDAFDRRTSEWMTVDNHNYRRISRILGSLSLLGLSAYASAFLGRLLELSKTSAGSEAIGKLTLWHWQRSVPTE